ncbi:MAG: thiamine pyrophosphate-dependent enzyme [Pseudomonadota bacterium]|nr:thiamine pyrophosphate-dependent enzyme [Pseudomonadota bacterium]
MSNTANECTRAKARVMNRSDLTRRLTAKLHGNEAVIGGIGNNNFDLWAAGQRPENFYMLGSMGLAAPIAIGVALAQPQRRVFALEGDGSLLMQLGSLGTIAAAKLPNLVVVVFDNGMYQITGKQPTLTASTVDLVAVARGAGLVQSAWAADEAHFDERVDAALGGPGPWLIAARIDDQKPAGTTERDPARIRQRFMAAIAVKA